VWTNQRSRFQKFELYNLDSDALITVPKNVSFADGGVLNFFDDNDNVIQLSDNGGG
jgi:hypothetical protein